MMCPAINFTPFTQSALITLFTGLTYLQVQFNYILRKRHKMKGQFLLPAIPEERDTQNSQTSSSSNGSSSIGVYDNLERRESEQERFDCLYDEIRMKDETIINLQKTIFERNEADKKRQKLIEDATQQIIRKEAAILELSQTITGQEQTKRRLTEDLSEHIDKVRRLSTENESLNQRVTIQSNDIRRLSSTIEDKDICLERLEG